MLTQDLNLTWAGLLQEGRWSTVLEGALQYAQDADGPPEHVESLNELVAAMEGSNDPDLEQCQFILAQCLIARFKRDLAPPDATNGLRIIRRLNRKSSLPEKTTSYERGRMAYEVGRRTGDPLLLEEAEHFYREALGLWSRFDIGSKRTIRSQIREVQHVRTGLLLRSGFGLPARGARTIAQLEIAMESVPVDRECLRSRRGPLRQFPPVLGVQVLDMFVAVSFLKTKRPRRQSIAPGGRDSRGKEPTGAYATTHVVTDNEVDQMSVAFVHPGTREETREFLADRARELFQWGERVNRWADALTQKEPFEGVWARFDYLYGYLNDSQGREPLTLNADEPWAITGFSLRAPHVLSRYEVSFILNRLAKHPIPVCVELLRLAQHSLLTHEPRRAVIEAGTAAESALSVLLNSRSDGAARNQRWTLGKLAAEASKIPDVLPPGETQASIENALIRPRNDAVHRALVTRKVASDAVEMTVKLVDHLLALSEADVVDLDERLTALAPWLDEYQQPQSGYNLLDPEPEATTLRRPPQPPPSS